MRPPQRVAASLRAADAWLIRHEGPFALLLPPLLFLSCVLLQIELFCCANTAEAKSALQTMSSVAVGLAALVVPLLVLVVESAGRRGLDAPTQVLWRLTGLRGVVYFVYWTLVLELIGYVLVHRLSTWESGVATGGFLVLIVTMIRLAIATNQVIAHSRPGVIKEKWLTGVRDEAKALVHEDVISRLGSLMLDEDFGPTGIATGPTPGSALVLGSEQLTTVPIPMDVPLRYVDDIDVAVVKEAANRLMPSKDGAFRHVTFDIALGEVAAISLQHYADTSA